MKFQKFILSIYKPCFKASNNKLNTNKKSAEQLKYISGMNSLKFRSPIRHINEMSSQEMLERNFQLKQIMNQYKSLTKDYNINKKHHENFFLYSKKDLEYDKDNNNSTEKNNSILNKFKSDLNNHINKMRKSNSCFYKYPSLTKKKNDKDINNQLLNKVSQMKKSQNLIDPNFIYKYLSQTNIFNNKNNLYIRSPKNNIFKIAEMERISKNKNKNHHSTNYILNPKI